MAEDFIYLSPPCMSGRERALLLEAFDSNWIAPVGPDLAAFEAEVAHRVGVRHAVALASGTAGLHLALVALGVGPGDLVLVPSFTFAATANAVHYAGATPVFVDSSADTWNVDPALVEETLQKYSRSGTPVRALVTVDLYGQCCDYDELHAICDHFGVQLVEDAAEALGATYRGRQAGGFGDAAIISFNGNKIITTGGGGMLLTDDERLADRVRHLATQAREPVAHYEHREIGYNYRLSNLLAAIGRGQLASLDSHLAARRRIRDAYREAFRDVPGVDLMPEAGFGTGNCWLTCVTIDPDRFGSDAEDVRRQLELCGIESRPTWKPLHLQPVFADVPMVGGDVCTAVFRQGLCLPSGSALTPEQQGRVIDTFLSTPEAARLPRRTA